MDIRNAYKVELEICKTLMYTNNGVSLSLFLIVTLREVVFNEFFHLTHFNVRKMNIVSVNNILFKNFLAFCKIDQVNYVGALLVIVGALLKFVITVLVFVKSMLVFVRVFCENRGSTPGSLASLCAYVRAY